MNRFRNRIGTGKETETTIGTRQIKETAEKESETGLETGTEHALDDFLRIP